MMEAIKVWSLVTGILSGITVSLAAQWSYIGETGPLYWHELFPQECSGKHQSPIDINPEKTTYNSDLKDFSIWYDPPKPDSKMFLRNNGHTVQVDLEGDFYVTNGGLTSVYNAVQFHFHWGHKPHHGSEHLIEGKPSPIELHLVSYNQEAEQLQQAVREKGGLAVLGVMYEISEEDNPSLAPIVNAIKYVRDPEVLERIDLPLMSMRDFLPHDLSRYYRYNGSLTTPGCFESVIWTVFDAKQSISHRQLREFTTLLQKKRKHGKGHKEEGDRHRRSLTKGEKEKERRAEQVLVELGIRGDDDEEAYLRSELMQEKMMGDMPHDEVVIIREPPTSPESKHMIDEERAARIDASIDAHVGENEHTKHKSESSYSKQGMEEMEKVDHETIVNNFRPVQPINDRIVYRSFKLRDVVTSEEGKLGQSQAAPCPNYHTEHCRGNSASNQVMPTAVILMVLFFKLGFM